MNNKENETNKNETKICRTCNEEKTLKCFGNRRGTKDGKGIYCKLCSKIANSRSYYNNLDTKKAYIEKKKKIAKKHQELNQPSTHKECTVCRKTKLISNFYKNKQEIDGHDYRCCLCCKQYREKNKDKIKTYRPSKEKSKQYFVEYNQRPEVIKRKEEKKIIKKQNKKHRKLKTIEEKRETRRKRDYLRYNNDPCVRLEKIIRSRLYKILKNNKGSKRTLEYIGCSPIEYKQHIEKQFLPEMNWDNYNIIWQVDHIVPTSFFNLKNHEDILKAFHYTNTQPLFKTTDIARSMGYFNIIGNLNKSNKILI